MRITSLDAMRGIAILGILFMNIPFHAHIMMGYAPFDPRLLSDTVMSAFNTIFFDGRFRTLFSILFGAGVAIQFASLQKKHLNTTIFLKTRLRWLLLFGAIHCVFIFGGDILMLYSISALLLIKGLELSNEALFKKAKKLLIIGSILCLVYAGLTIAFMPLDQQPIRGSEVFIEMNKEWYGNYIYQVITQAAFGLIVIVTSPLAILWQVLGLMYLGVYLYRTGFFVSGFEPSTLKKIVIAAIVTSALCLLPQLLDNDMPFAAIPLIASVSAIFMALVYAHFIVKACQSSGSLLNWFVAPGKIAFTLYISQSVVLGILLRWVIPEFNATATLSEYFLISIVFTLIQIVFANWYVKHFEQGPLEKLWRKNYLRSAYKKQQKLAETGE
ncbi:DUF418 domain-containing protein [Glaciecola sp. XM2]|jgi:uncharacterized protein|uniref:DUF418 domain-containing protein n=1 Tax=Glaciecola sp. XM2 TaxID=1914931 RepID=UPI001BDE989F|nr:DUF418 domain-containing protein [Glaciecola sp. XM2]MBT1449652.1 DUF418 domain-containing protein [Glaciecola sp. XM2]